MSPAHSPDRPAPSGAPSGAPGGVSAEDLAVLAAQLGRPARGVRRVAHRCPCGAPDVVETAPRLPDGTPFPTLFYLTCPRAAAAVSTLESAGMMRELTERLATDAELAEGYRRAHADYLARREAVEPVQEIAGTSAGGMPERVKCLHALLAHALAAGPGVNPVGDLARAALPAWWVAGSCAESTGAAAGAQREAGTVMGAGR